MYVNDPIADMLTRIRNAIIAKRDDVIIPHSKVKEEIARLLVSEGYIDDYTVEEEQFKSLRLTIKYIGAQRMRRAVISGLRRISKPGRRMYTGHQDIPWVMSGMGTAILTTPKGVMTDQEARRAHVGGEVLAYIW